MAKPELGTKRACPTCSAKVYDLGRRPARCPKCETEFDPELEDPRIKSAPEKDVPEDDEKKPAPADDDGYGDEDDDTPEVDAEADRIPDSDDDDDDDENGSGLSDDIPDGFEEDDVDGDDDDDDDTSVLLDDEDDEDFGDFNIDKDEDL